MSQRPKNKFDQFEHMCNMKEHIYKNNLNSKLLLTIDQLVNYLKD